MPMVELGSWAPDQPSVSNGGLQIAQNTIPAERGYDSMPSLTTQSQGNVNSVVRGAGSGRTRSGTHFIAAGSSDRLYIAGASGLANVSNGGGSPYSLTPGDWWDFVLYGNRLIASSYAHPMESYIFGSSVQFGALSADSPLARHMAVVRDFVVAGNIAGRGANAATIGTAEDGIQWCALDNPTSWPQVGTNAAASVQSDWQPLAGNGGSVNDVIGGSDYGLVFQQRAIWRMDYEGGNTFFRLTPIDENRGCSIPKAAIRVGALTYFVSDDGFMATDGVQTVPIGNEVVDQFFADRVDISSNARLSAAYFPGWKCVVWLFVGQGAANQVPNSALLYNVQSNRWAFAEIAAEWLTAVPPVNNSLDSDATSLDSGTFASVNLDSLTGAGVFLPGAFDATHGISAFTGSALSSLFVTHEFEPAPGRVGTIRSLRPVYDNRDSAQFSAFVKRRMRMADAQAMTSSANEDATGKMSIRTSGRYMAAGFNGSGSFRNFRGFDVDLVTRGAR